MGFGTCVKDIGTRRLDTSLFPEVKWSDPEPRELILKPIKEE